MMNELTDEICNKLHLPDKERRVRDLIAKLEAIEGKTTNYRFDESWDYSNDREMHLYMPELIASVRKAQAPFPPKCTCHTPLLDF